MNRQIISLTLSGIITLFTIGGSVISLQRGYDKGFYMIYESSNREKVFSRDVEIEIEKGFDLIDIAQELYDQKIIASKTLFVSQGIIYGYESKIKKGTYTISSNMSNVEIFKVLTSALN
ncbi:hypothetical protein AN640_06645 [Candidatus Epulonipiscium fishelsonii]|uniref:Uncharacterized protein n=1 Tax=Candidatus Epulonipiscium fishelsonii TaxID=77094 RepID=A0ACC8XHH6_9FIRM|nr:hypothetical protein AN640_06645 [Epulopiscium sp. SCG-D08WGA-EpuloA1]OON95446.1 MAG: hypothetical protein ATN32_07100 [Epulopiscium sp. AS2M-Bin002]